MTLRKVIGERRRWVTKEESKGVEVQEQKRRRRKGRTKSGRERSRRRW